MQLESSWFSGRVEVLCPDILVCYAIDGNIRSDIGALAQSRSMSKEENQGFKRFWKSV